VSPDPWLETGSWRDVPDDQEGMHTCEANRDPESALGLCPEHEAKMWAKVTRRTIEENR
jgi:hypothetical protein